MSQQSSATELTSSLYGGSGAYDPTLAISNTYLPSSSVQEFIHWDSPALAEAANEAASSSDKSKITAAMDQAQQIIHDAAPVIYGAIPEVLVPIPHYVHGFVLQTTDAVYPCLFYLLRIQSH